jgi:hypothetical protein
MRDTTPDSLGMAIKRRLLEETVRDDPTPTHTRDGCWSVAWEGRPHRPDASDGP